MRKKEDNEVTETLSFTYGYAGEQEIQKRTRIKRKTNNKKNIRNKEERKEIIKKNKGEERKNEKGN